MKCQCDEHGCNELLCGCRVDVLEDSKYISEQCQSKDKWIKELLKENKLLKEQYECLRLSEGK